MTKAKLTQDGLMYIDYMSEKQDDDLLENVKTVCFLYLEDPSLIDEYKSEELHAMQTFLTVKYDEVSSKHKSLKLRNNHYPFIEMNRSLNEILISSSLESETPRRNIELVEKEANYLITTMAFSHGILMKILNDRNYYDS